MHYFLKRISRIVCFTFLQTNLLKIFLIQRTFNNCIRHLQNANEKVAISIQALHHSTEVGNNADTSSSSFCFYTLFIYFLYCTRQKTVISMCTFFRCKCNETPMKYFGFAKWHTIRGHNLCVPVELQHNKAVIFPYFSCHWHTFLLLPLAHFSSLGHCCKHLISVVSCALYMFSGRYPLKTS